MPRDESRSLLHWWMLHIHRRRAHVLTSVVPTEEEGTQRSGSTVDTKDSPRVCLSYRGGVGRRTQVSWCSARELICWSSAAELTCAASHPSSDGFGVLLAQCLLSPPRLAIAFLSHPAVYNVYVYTNFIWVQVLSGCAVPWPPGSRWVHPECAMWERGK